MTYPANAAIEICVDDGSVIVSGPGLGAVTVDPFMAMLLAQALNKAAQAAAMGFSIDLTPQDAAFQLAS